MQESKPPLFCDKISPYKSSCTFKLENKKLLNANVTTLPRIVLRPDMSQWLRHVTCVFTILDMISVCLSSLVTSLAPDCSHVL